MSQGSGEHVLVVDDEPQILRALGVILRNAGYEVATAATKSEALDAVSVRPPDVMVLDLVLPDGSGVDVTSEVRRWSSLPIIVLSAVGDEGEKVRALDVGADDYITKPFGTDELLARLRAVLRRAAGNRDEPVVNVGPIAIDLTDRRVTRDGDEVHLTPIEFDIVRELAGHVGKLVTQRQLLQAVWGPGYDLETHYLRVHIAHIRAKLEPDPSNPRYLITEPGVGYRLREPLPDDRTPL
jgi:two-component system, OmpR family, KDP operon response regulator KdpE